MANAFENEAAGKHMALLRADRTLIIWRGGPDKLARQEPSRLSMSVRSTVPGFQFPAIRSLSFPFSFPCPSSVSQHECVLNYCAVNSKRMMRLPGQSTREVLVLLVYSTQLLDATRKMAKQKDIVTRIY